MAPVRIAAVEANRLIREQGYSYLDVRSVEEFVQGHPEGAYNIPLRLLSARGLVDNADFLRTVRAAFGKDHKLVVGCQTGKRSLAAANQLIADGFSNVIDQRAGYEGARDPFGRITDQGWRASGLPCAATPLPGHDYAALKPQ